MFSTFCKAYVNVGSWKLKNLPVNAKMKENVLMEVGEQA